MAESEMLFVRAPVEGADNPWDDTELIQAYEAAFKKVSEELGVEQPKSEKKRGRQWRKGDFCRCLFTEDGEIYEAKFVKTVKNGKCLIKYLGYENEEIVDLSQLMKTAGKKSRQRQIKQATSLDDGNTSVTHTEESVDGPGTATQSENESMSRWKQFNAEPIRTLERAGPSLKRESATFKSSSNHSTPGEKFSVPAPPPPLPPLFQRAGNVPVDCDEALNAMLLSWYMSGYHTGYYEGLKNSKRQP